MATQTADDQLALEGLWALNVTAGIDDQLAFTLLKHPYPYVRYWTIRLVGDRNIASPKVIEHLNALAASEPSPNVRGQLAATAKRLPGADCLQIVQSLLCNNPHESDPRIPWLIWWAFESKAMTDTQLIVDRCSQRSMWENPAARNMILLLIRRYAAEGTAPGYEACATLLRAAPASHADSTLEYLRQGLAERAIGLQGIGQGDLYGEQAAAAAGEPSAAVRHYEPLAPSLKEYIAALWQRQRDNPVRLELALRADTDGAYTALKAAAFQLDQEPERHVQLSALLREFGRPDLAPALITLLDVKHPNGVTLAALDVLAAYDDPSVTTALTKAYPAAAKEVRHRIRDILFSRAATAVAFLQTIDPGEAEGHDIPIDQLRRLSVHKNEGIDTLVRQRWGNIGPGSTEEKLATMRRFNNDLRAAAGNPGAGHLLYEKNCGVCHQLFGHGNKIGPDLTTANRSDRAALLANIVDPNAVIRHEFMNYVVVTTSGRLLTGVMAEQDGASVTIVDANNQRTKIPRNEVEELHESEVSLMPERLLENLSPEELRDLFAYLQDTPADSIGATP
jgi:putative heme-binding domain-containing protein